MYKVELQVAGDIEEYMYYNTSQEAIDAALTWSVEETMFEDTVITVIKEEVLFCIRG